MLRPEPWFGDATRQEAQEGFGVRRASMRHERDARRPRSPAIDFVDDEKGSVSRNQ